MQQQQQQQIVLTFWHLSHFQKLPEAEESLKSCLEFSASF